MAGPVAGKASAKGSTKGSAKASTKGRKKGGAAAKSGAAAASAGGASAGVVDELATGLGAGLGAGGGASDGLPIPCTTPGMKRKRAGKWQSHAFGIHEQRLIGTVYTKCKEFVSGSLKKSLRTVALLFQFMMGGLASVSSGLEYSNRLESGATLAQPLKTGPESNNVHARFEGFYDWVFEKVDASKKKGNVTLPSLKRALQEEHGVRCSERFLRKALKKAGFRYVKRDGAWISRRNEYRVQEKLWYFLEWAVQHSLREELSAAEYAEMRGDTVGDGSPKRKKKAKNDDGKFFAYAWTMNVAFQDETAIQTNQKTPHSWCLTSDKKYDYGPKGKGYRVNVLHTIFGHHNLEPLEPKTGLPKAFKCWSSNWKGQKKHEFVGSTVTSEHIDKYFADYVFCEVGQGDSRVLIDNASTHKKMVQRLKEMDVDALDLQIREKTDCTDPNSRKSRLRRLYRKDYPDCFRSEADAKDLRKFIRTHHLFDTTLSDLAEMFETSVQYLPQYHPECNPIERYWAMLKRLYNAADSDEPWQNRVKIALHQIPRNFANLCIQKSLEWVYERHAVMKAAGWGTEDAPTGDAPQVEVYENDDDDFISDESSDVENE